MACATAMYQPIHTGRLRRRPADGRAQLSSSQRLTAVTKGVTESDRINALPSTAAPGQQMRPCVRMF